MLLVKRGLLPSMSCKGNCWDNAVTERFFLNRLDGQANRDYARVAALDAQDGTGLADQAGAARHLRHRYDPRRGRASAQALAQLGQPLPTRALQASRQNDHQASYWRPKRLLGRQTQGSC